MRSMRQAAYAVLVFVVLVVVAGVPGTAQAQDRIGGHIGVVFPLVTHVEGSTVTIGDDFKIGVPMGITVKTGETVAFDLEIVPMLDPQNKAKTIQWVADNMNENKLLFGTPLVIDFDALAEWVSR